MNAKMNVDSAVYLAGITAVLYTWSTAYYHGFLGTLNLDADMMERSFHQVIYSGFLVSFAPAFLMLLLSSSIMYFYSYEILPNYIDWVRSSIGSNPNIAA